MCILPPQPGQPGTWQEKINEAGAECWFLDGERLLGFALGGNRIQAHVSLIKQAEASIV
jgi:hypothetical protein